MYALIGHQNGYYVDKCVWFLRVAYIDNANALTYQTWTWWGSTQVWTHKITKFAGITPKMFISNPASSERYVGTDFQQVCSYQAANGLVPYMTPCIDGEQFLVNFLTGRMNQDDDDGDTGKTVIPENANSETCKKCGGQNTKIALARFYAYYCPKCEK